ncbi:MAG TPA: YncE family protein [Casimicrobiaceae bacterium]|nr:YncE family protein [Casimicrobiaceae bacterium]
MKLRISLARTLAATLLTLTLSTFDASAQLAVSSNDGKAVLVNGVNTVPPNPAEDTVTLIDLGVSPPRVVGELKAPSSVVGPPQNVAITPDESIALVSANMKLDPADPKKTAPDNRLSVIDLKASPPAVIATLETGLGPAGISINRAGTLALVTNRNEGTVSVLVISGKTLTAAGKVDLGNPRSLPSSVAFSPDGKMALVTRYGDHKISVLSVDGNKVEDTKQTMTGGFQPYAIQVSPKGDVAVVGNQGGNTGDIDTINVIDLKSKAPRIVHTLDVGQIVEGLAFSNDGNYVALTAQDGSARAPNHPFYNENGLVVVFSVNGTNLTKVAEAKIGKWNQGVVWSRDGKTLLAQNMLERSLSILSFDGNNLKVTGEIKVSGGPEGLRTAER